MQKIFNIAFLLSCLVGASVAGESNYNSNSNDKKGFWITPNVLPQNQ